MRPLPYSGLASPRCHNSSPLAYRRSISAIFPSLPGGCTQDFSGSLFRTMLRLRSVQGLHHTQADPTIALYTLSQSVHFLSSNRRRGSEPTTAPSPMLGTQFSRFIFPSPHEHTSQQKTRIHFPFYGNDPTTTSTAAHTPLAPRSETSDHISAPSLVWGCATVQVHPDGLRSTSVVAISFSPYHTLPAHAFV